MSARVSRRWPHTSTCPIAAVKHRSLPVYGLQFHPEVTHTPLGRAVLANFLIDICGCHGHAGGWAILPSRPIDGHPPAGSASDRVICGLSGGVDSSVVAALLYRAIGSQLSCILVDNGLLRKDEEDVGHHASSPALSEPICTSSRPKDNFLTALAGVTDPQEKRRRIGHAFIDCFTDEAAKISGAHFLAQGTLYPDVIESGAAADGPAATIKLHHNVGGLPEDLSSN